ncbi:MAG: helix-turn-helix transcriptional regulator [Porticoccaceae bacterium]
MQFTDCGERIKQVQRQKNVATAFLATELGVSRHQIYRWREMQDIKVHTVFKLCQAMGITIQDFFEE